MPNMQNTIPNKLLNVIPTNIDHIPSNITYSGSSAILYVFEDNEAGGMFHEPTELLWIGCLTGLIRTQRFKSVTLTPNTNSQTCCTKRNFTRDEWNNLLHLFNITHFSSTCCTKNSSLISCSTMAKRIQDHKEERLVATSSDESIFFYCDKC